ncbi:hypothetical protein [Rhodococcus ruber]|uniref:hypothetical protein n=1 Tax=Rhodococcus ruber TaxID=1830 RepID=UPI0011AB7076|nr:hypothetical protein [Rhodococcus ruber]
MTETSSLVDHAKAWMRLHGWRQVSEGSAGWMWQLDDSSEGDSRRLALVRTLEDDETAYSGVVRRLAEAHQQAESAIDRALRLWDTDVTVLRAANDFVIVDTIPLNAGAAMLESARLMFRSAATAAVKLRSEIAGSYSRIGDAVAESVRMGHTERGSYMIPVYVRLSEPEQPSDFEGPFEGMELQTLGRPESAERRMTRTFAEAMLALHTHVLTPEPLPRGDQVMELVSAGVTREFVSAVTRVLDDDAVSEFETRFEWAPACSPPASAPTAVSVPADAKSKLVETSRRLKSASKREFNIMTGPIVTVTKFPDNPVVYATIHTTRHGRLCAVEARLTNTPLDLVTKWMTDSETVQLQGVVTRAGSHLRVDNPVGFGPLRLPG